MREGQAGGHKKSWEGYELDKDVKQELLNLLKTSRGQISGIIKMLEDDRYCVDISKQLLAVQGLLKKVNQKNIDQHIKNCVKEAIIEGQGDEKIDEVLELIDIYAK
ncbi:MAG TPA: metal-sensing transcriptional repressor [Bacillota bacterium]|nr:metal-sensing transcriptional repressor [Bacillota bacterium]